MKKMENMLLGTMAALFIGAFLLMGAWENGSFPFVGMVLGCFVIFLSLFIVYSKYMQLREIQAYRAQRAARRAAQQRVQAARSAFVVCVGNTQKNGTRIA